MRGNPFENAFSRYPVVTNLMIINALMLLATFVALRTFRVDLVSYLGLFYPASDHFRPYQFVTHMFMHANLTHLFFNMLALYMFGRIIEMRWGGQRFFIYYFVTGLGAALLHTLVNWVDVMMMEREFAAVLSNLSVEGVTAFLYREFPEYARQLAANGWLDKLALVPDLDATVRSLFSEIRTLRVDIPTVGASGAVYGVLLAFGVLFPDATIYLLIPPLPIKAKWLVILYAGLELTLGLSQPGSSVAHFAHLGGMIFGYLLIRYWRRHGQLGY